MRASRAMDGRDGMKLDGAVCIVTGGGTGTGAACAALLASKGCRVLVNYSRSEHEARAVVRDCQGAGVDALAVRGDVAVDADCRALAQAALQRWGRIDALVNNAGITRFAHPARLDALSAQDFHDIYDVNVVGAYQMRQRAAPRQALTRWRQSKRQSDERKGGSGFSLRSLRPLR